MLIPIDEIYFKEKVKIKFDNIIQGFNNYKNKTIKAIDNKDFENKMLGFLKEAALLNNIDNSFVDFYYNFLKQEDKNKLENMLSENGKKFLMDFKAKNSTKGVYYKLPIDSIEFINKMNCKEILFSTIYFTKIPCTIWGNYNNKFPIFYKSEKDLTNYKNIAQKYNLIIE